MRSLLSAIGFGVLTIPAVASAATVTIHLSGVSDEGGTMRVALYDEATFMKAKPLYSGSAEVARAGTLDIVIPDVKAGDYAVMAMHDADDNGRMKMGDNGMPAEGTAISNASAMRGPPSFSVNKIVISDDDTTIALAMHYPDGNGW